MKEQDVKELARQELARRKQEQEFKEFGGYSLSIDYKGNAIIKFEIPNLKEHTGEKIKGAFDLFVNDYKRWF